MKVALFSLLAVLPLALSQSSSVAPVVPSSAVPTTPPTVPSPQVPSTPPSVASPPPTQPPSVVVPPTQPPSDSASEPTFSSSTISSIVTTAPPSSVPSANVSSSANVTMSANVTSSAMSPNATANVTDIPTWYPFRTDDILFEDVSMDLGVPAFEADEAILTLAYMANINKDTCMNLATQYAAGASPDLRRHFADLEYARRKRKRATYSKRCLATTYEIPTYVHWILPAGETTASWTSASVLNLQLKMAQEKLNGLGASLKLKQTKVWTGDGAAKFTSNKWAITSKEYVGFVGKVKSLVGATGSRNLHIFIVADMGGRTDGTKKFTTLGRANFPGKAQNAAQADCVVMIKDNLPKPGADSKRTNSVDTLWSTLPHEVGHWLGLIHLHDNGPGGGGKDGCAGKGDLVAGTLKYRDGTSYATSCGGTDMGPGGLAETNIMSYADGVKYNQARFIPEQRVRATVGWMIRRDGLTGANSDIRRVYTGKDCDAASKVLSGRSTRLDGVYPDSVVGPHKRMLSVRATAAELQRFCARTDLVVADHDFSPIAEGGIYNPASVAIPGDTTQRVPDVDVGAQADLPGVTTGSNFDTLKQQVEARVAGGGQVDQPYSIPAAVTVTAVPTTGTGGTGSGAFKTAGWVSSGLGLVGVVVGGLMVL